MATKESENSMRALVAKTYCAPEKFEVVDMPRPGIKGPNDVQVQVYAASINPRDMLEAKGVMRMVQTMKPPIILGKDLSGVVAGVGSAVSKFKIGDAVFGMQPLENWGAGSISEYAVIAEEELVAKPPNLTHLEAASLPMIFYTVTTALRRADARLPNGLRDTTVLIPAALSGTGSAALQLAKHVFGAAKVITTTSTSKRALVPQYLGESTVDQVIDYKTQELAKEVPAKGVDFAFHTKGSLTALIPLVKPHGVLFTIAAVPSGKNAKRDQPSMPGWLAFILDLVQMYYNWALRGSQVQYDFVFGAHRNGELERVGEWVAEKKFRPVVGKVVDLEDLDAVKKGCMEVANGTGGVGKFVIRMVKDEL